MGHTVANRTENASQRGDRALALLSQLDDLAAIHARIDLVRDRDAGYRGAAAFEEPIHQPYLAGPAPELATVIAADGSQVYPDAHASALYYLTNIGIFSFYNGSEDTPTGDSEPHLFYQDEDLRDHKGQGALIKNTAVNARRSVQELQTLTDYAIENRGRSGPIVALRDGPLLWWLGGDVPQKEGLEATYYNALRNFYGLHLDKQDHQAANASLVGYVERGDSRFVVRLLHLMGLPEERVTRAELDGAGPFEGVDDYWLFERVLEYGERSAVMIQQSPQNKFYKLDVGESYEILFFYLNVSRYKPHIVRIEIPMWVALASGAIEEVHSLVLEQCDLTGNYPYALTRADELAVVASHEKRELENMIETELLRYDQSIEKSPKQQGKDYARASRQRYGV